MILTSNTCNATVALHTLISPHYLSHKSYLTFKLNFKDILNICTALSVDKLKATAKLKRSKPKLTKLYNGRLSSKQKGDTRYTKKGTLCLHSTLKHHVNQGTPQIKSKTKRLGMTLNKD